MNEKILTEADAQRLLMNMGARMKRTDGAAAIYVAPSVNLTITVFPHEAGKKRVRIVRGCVC